MNKDNYSITNSAELFDSDKHTWTQLPNMLSERAEFTAAFLPDGRVMVIGGRLKNGDVTATTEIFDPYITKSWQQGPGMNYARLNPGFLFSVYILHIILVPQPPWATGKHSSQEGLMCSLVMTKTR